MSLITVCGYRRETRASLSIARVLVVGQSFFSVGLGGAPSSAEAMEDGAAPRESCPSFSPRGTRSACGQVQSKPKRSPLITQSASRAGRSILRQGYGGRSGALVVVVWWFVGVSLRGLKSPIKRLSPARGLLRLCFAKRPSVGLPSLTLGTTIGVAARVIPDVPLLVRSPSGAAFQGGYKFASLPTHGASHGGEADDEERGTSSVNQDCRRNRRALLARAIRYQSALL